MIGSRLEALVSSQAARTPTADALVCEDQRLTYKELDDRSNQLARLLLSLDCRVGDRVCLFMPKGIDAIVAMLATLKSGAAYVPVDLESPAIRARRILDACSPTVIVVADEGCRLLDELLDHAGQKPAIVASGPDSLSAQNFRSNGSFADLDALSAAPVQKDVGDEDTAHILFTSGSTGTPKGVVITHRNVVGFLHWATSYFGVCAGDRISGHPPLHFDLSTFDIYGSLATGATLHLVPQKLNLLAPRLAAWMRDSELTQWFSVPSILTYMANFDAVKQDDFPHLQRLIWCGEVLPTPTLMYWMERLPHVTFTNLYGPTEATIASSYYTVPHIPADETEDIPIGSACEGEELLVLDENLEPAPAHEIGDLYIRGIGLSPGYWQDDEKTRAVFVQHPASDDAADLIYRTGDLARIDEHGLFRYLGRADSQIKSRGHRIELGEIETALNTLDYVHECAVVGVDSGGFEGTSICCAFVTDKDADVTPVMLRKDLAALVPRYMIPAQWMDMAALPKNANGKIDRSNIRGIFEDELRAKKNNQGRSVAR
ncbi:MAG: amino acid adenylation domain-containing protein [Gammaproteobacteria bacterium]|nr:amino acid adenylation domain-containing protein [Gammaproteobacteria bacterium]